jgi:small subunit ribosomal protein S24e
VQLEVLARKENPLLKRTEVRFKAVHKAEPTPTRDALRAFLAKELKATKDIVVIDSQASTFGRYETQGYAKVYKSKEEALAVERKHILVRNKLIEPEVKEKKAAAPKPEKPAPRAEKAEKPAVPPKAEGPKPEAKAEAKPEAKAEKAPPKEEKKAAPKDEKKPAEKKEEKKEEKKDEKKAEPKKKGGK